MPKQFEENEIKLPPSTRVLTEMRKGKGPDMLTKEEKELLPQSSLEMWEECIKARDSISSNGSITSFMGMLSDKTDHVATLQEIESAVADGWAGKASKKEE